MPQLAPVGRRERYVPHVDAVRRFRTYVVHPPLLRAGHRRRKRLNGRVSAADIQSLSRVALISLVPARNAKGNVNDAVNLRNHGRGVLSCPQRGGRHGHAVDFGGGAVRPRARVKGLLCGRQRPGCRPQRAVCRRIGGLGRGNRRTSRLGCASGGFQRGFRRCRRGLPGAVHIVDHFQQLAQVGDDVARVHNHVRGPAPDHRMQDQRRCDYAALRKLKAYVQSARHGVARRVKGHARDVSGHLPLHLHGRAVRAQKASQYGRAGQAGWFSAPVQLRVDTVRLLVPADEFDAQRLFQRPLAQFDFPVDVNGQHRFTTLFLSSCRP